MPEGDTVWLAGQRLHEALAGRELTRSDFRVPQLATTDLSGRTVREVVSRGKHLLTRIDDDLTLHTHFRMDGTWHLYRTGERWRGGPAWQVRVVLENAQWQAVGYRLPVVELLPRSAEQTAVGHLGPDILGPDWDRGEPASRGEAEAVRRLLLAPEREVGDALLDQRNVAGFGTVYRAETLFVTGVSPWTKVGEVDDLRGIIRAGRRLMLANRDHPWQNTTGDRRRGREHWIYNRAGQPCRRCGTPIRSDQQGQAPYSRTTYWCPRCQPARPTSP